MLLLYHYVLIIIGISTYLFPLIARIHSPVMNFLQGPAVNIGNKLHIMVISGQMYTKGNYSVDFSNISYKVIKYSTFH